VEPEALLTGDPGRRTGSTDAPEDPDLSPASSIHAVSTVEPTGAEIIFSPPAEKFA
jgi:hypothetical protein